MTKHTFVLQWLALSLGQGEEERLAAKERVRIGSLPRNVWAVSLTSSFMDISSEMVLGLLPLFLASVLGASAPFFFGAAMAGLAALLMAIWRPSASRQPPVDQ